MDQTASLHCIPLSNIVLGVYPQSLLLPTRRQHTGEVCSRIWQGQPDEPPAQMHSLSWVVQQAVKYIIPAVHSAETEHGVHARECFAAELNPRLIHIVTTPLSLYFLEPFHLDTPSARIIIIGSWHKPI